MTAKIEGENLIISIPLNKKGILSASKKSLVHASSNGNKETTVEVNGKKLVIGLNAYTPAQ